MPAHLEPMQGRIERPLAGTEAFPGDLANAIRDAPPVIRAKGEDLQDQEIRGSPEVGQSSARRYSPRATRGSLGPVLSKVKRNTEEEYGRGR